MAALTVGDVKTSLAAWMREDVTDSVAFDAIKDSIISIWETLVCISLSELLGGPVDVTFAPANGALNMTTTDLEADSDSGEEGGDGGDLDDVWYIHSLSLKTPDGVELFFEGTEVGSELWRRFARGLAGTSQYQQFVYDFDGKKFSATPNPARSLTPGFFYIKRPPAVVDNDTEIPFNHPGGETFIRYNSISLLKLSVEEYAAAAQWLGRAEDERQRIIRSSAQKNVRKNLRVQPLFR